MAIENEHQYYVTTEQLFKFYKAMISLENEKDSLHPLQYKVNKEALESVAEELDSQIQEYEQMQLEKRRENRQLDFFCIVISLIAVAMFLYSGA